MHPRLLLSQREKEFLEAWMWDEAHFQDVNAGSAKKLQIEKDPCAAPLLADIASAAMSAEEQVAVASGSKPAGVPCWPWRNDEDFRARYREARAWLDSRRPPLVPAAE